MVSGETQVAGGSSGGGSINLFYKNSIEFGSITANGGENTPGGKGGNGSITIGNISTGTYSEYDRNLIGAEELAISGNQNKNLDSGKYVIYDNTNISNESIVINEDQDVTLIIKNNLNINNKSSKKAAIDIKPNATLTLYVDSDTNLSSGTADKGVNATASSQGAGGAGGYAGIHVPEGATLNIYGNSELYAYGGDAGNGGDTVSYNTNCNGGGGGGAGAGIGGNGGNGGNAGQTSSLNGGDGENAGNINIYNTVVYAYGGSGGSGGRTYVDGGGAGGYPAAGIGGGGAGGAGGKDPVGGGGFTGGSSECNNYNYVRHNGLSSYSPIWAPPSGGYFSKNTDSYSSGSYSVGSIGGGGTWGAGNGGTAGKGGTVLISSSNVYAYNGSYITSSDSGSSGNEWGKYQCPIYLQLGISLQKMRESSIVSVNSRIGSDLLTELASYIDTNILKTNYNNRKPITDGNTSLGIGSGAGFIELSNGTLNVE